MKEDIQHPSVTDVGIAIIQEESDLGLVWNVYLINQKDVALENVLITSKGYGTVDKETVKTSVLRHSLGTVEGHSFSKVEAIIETLFSLSNEFWLSFYIDDMIYDKKFVFLPETINETFFTTIPLLNKRGVIII